MALRFFKIAVVYLLLGVILGIHMAITHDFTNRGVHAHINLLGWATLAVAGMIYHVCPAMTQSRLAAIHFWLHNISLPVGIGGIALALHNLPASGGPLAGAGAFLALLGFVSFAINLWRNGGRRV